MGSKKRGSSARAQKTEGQDPVLCPQCSGACRISVEVTEIASGGHRKKSSVDMKCITCDGAGKVSASVVAALKREQEMWCSCASPGEPQYFADGDDLEIWKHHWRCRACGKVLQIG